MNDERVYELAQDVAALKVGLASIEGKLDDLIHTLLGNGQPGVIADMRTEDKELGDRLEKVEGRTQWITGVWAGASAVVLGLFALIRFIFHR